MKSVLQEQERDAALAAQLDEMRHRFFVDF
jgi:hypothetical protein